MSNLSPEAEAFRTRTLAQIADLSRRSAEVGDDVLSLLCVDAVLGKPHAIRACVALLAAGVEPVAGRALDAHPDSTQLYPVRHACGHIVERRMRPSTAQAPAGTELASREPCAACYAAREGAAELVPVAS